MVCETCGTQMILYSAQDRAYYCLQCLPARSCEICKGIVKSLDDLYCRQCIRLIQDDRNPRTGKPYAVWYRAWRWVRHLSGGPFYDYCA